MECPAILGSGPRKGEPCGRPCRADEDRCARHSPHNLATVKTHARQEQFLAAFAATGVLNDAAAVTGVSRSSHYDWMDDPTYAARWREANEIAADVAERELWRRGVEGWDEPVYQGGQRVGMIRRHSDACLFGVLKSRRPEKFRDGPRTVVQAGAGFDANGQPYAGIQVSESIEALAENFARWQERHAIDVTSTES